MADIKSYSPLELSRIFQSAVFGTDFDSIRKAKLLQSEIEESLAAIIDIAAEGVTVSSDMTEAHNLLIKLSTLIDLTKTLTKEGK